MDCGNLLYHSEHDFIDEEAIERTCLGHYETLATFGAWQVVVDPEDANRGWVITYATDDINGYAIHSTQVHKGRAGGGETWEEHMADKVWATPHLDDLSGALNFARQRWPKKG